MVKVNEIKAQMKRKGLLQSDLAKAICMDPSTLSRKLNCSAGTKFTISEANKIGEALEFTREECADIFFAR